MRGTRPSPAKPGVGSEPGTWTPYPQLNTVLAELVTGAREALAANFVGAYLTGSFALGDADEFSDVDFIVVTRGEIASRQLDELQALHGRLHRLDVEWAQHLEGSYAPAGLLRRQQGPPSSFLFLDNGASELQWDPHCNTAVVRWVLRERGVVLAGPDATTLVDAISRDQLRTEARARVHEYGAWARERDEVGSMSSWKQAYLVVTFCRLLHTRATGRVSSKREAGAWAMAALDHEWTDLVRRALAARPHPWRRVHEPADPASVARTLAFAEYAVGEAATL